MNDLRLSTEVNVYNFIKEKIKLDFNLTGDLAEDYAALYDTADGQCSLPELLLRMARAVQRTERFSDAIDCVIAANTDRKYRLERKANKLRAMILQAMQDTGRKNLEGPDLTLSYHRGKPSVVITNERAVPKEYRKEVADVSKTKIRHGLEEGKQFPFAEWSNAGDVLVINTK